MAISECEINPPTGPEETDRPSFICQLHITHTYAHMQQINESILNLEHLKFTCGDKVLEWTCSRLISYRVELDGILLHVKLGNSTKVTCAGNLYPLLAN